MSSAEKATIVILSFAIGLFLATPTGTLRSQPAALISSRDAFEFAKSVYNTQVGVFEKAQAETQARRDAYNAENTDETKNAFNVAIKSQVGEMIEMSTKELAMIRAWLVWATEDRQYPGSQTFYTNITDLTTEIRIVEALANQLSSIDPVSQTSAMKAVRQGVIAYRHFDRKYTVGKYKTDKLVAAKNKIDNIYETKVFSVIYQLGYPQELNSALDRYVADSNTVGYAIVDAYRTFNGIKVTTDESEAAQLYNSGKDQVSSAKGLIESARESLLNVIDAIEKYSPSTGGVDITVKLVSSEVTKTDGAEKDESDYATFRIVFDITAIGSDVYIPFNGVIYSVDDGKLETITPYAFYHDGVIGSNDTLKVSKGETNRFTLNVIVLPTSVTSPDYVKLTVSGILWATTETGEQGGVKDVNFQSNRVFLVPRENTPALKGG